GQPADGRAGFRRSQATPSVDVRIITSASVPLLMSDGGCHGTYRWLHGRDLRCRASVLTFPGDGPSHWTVSPRRVACHCMVNPPFIPPEPPAGGAPPSLRRSCSSSSAAPARAPA